MGPPIFDLSQVSATTSAPALSLFRRLQACVDSEPSWAAYLPTELRNNTSKAALVLGRRSLGVSPSSRFAPAEAQHAASAAAPSATEQNCDDGGDEKALYLAVRNKVWTLSRDPAGCRDVQRALDVVADDRDRLDLAAELNGHVWDAMRCPYANYVLQKVITLLSAPALQFIVDEIVSKGERAIHQAARHKYGCRILQRLLEHCSPAQLQAIVAALVGEPTQALSIAKHAYGNYVMQHIMVHGTPSQRSLIIQYLEQNVSIVGRDEHACALIGKALQYSTPDERAFLARAFAACPDVVLTMLRSRHGHSAARMLLPMLNGE